MSDTLNHDILWKFIEVALHATLYYRRLYPKEIFVKKILYGTNVNFCKHPEVLEYIHNIVETLKALFYGNKASFKSLNFVCYDVNNIVIEKYIFFLKQSCLCRPKKTEDFFRSLYLRLSMILNGISPLPSQASFIVYILTNQKAYAILQNTSVYCDFPWLLFNHHELIKRGSLLPIEYIKAHYMILKIYAVQNKDTLLKVVYKY
ncbi:mitotic spindle assembly checkpoint protein MAD2B [Copidosoma floridanum]|uniref:mitotic spindle assembly checkpoint protein MAD2B n=1 Tax=Copidosoma floridanum TaxID=29053 RepID=UPI0006C9AABB|nr:mitotic spindle assembly checkpoint protein MAD2B [Copidosoma floridanum]